MEMGTATSPAPISYLDQYDSAPDAQKLNLVRRFMSDDPLSFFRELRTLRPVLVMLRAEAKGTCSGC
jgi:hypothetical protein